MCTAVLPTRELPHFHQPSLKLSLINSHSGRLRAKPNLVPVCPVHYRLMAELVGHIRLHHMTRHPLFPRTHQTSPEVLEFWSHAANRNFGYEAGEEMLRGVKHLQCPRCPKTRDTKFKIIEACLEHVANQHYHNVGSSRRNGAT
ncbi:hypothetical protein GCK72_015456 [Caenorhabditis remanei]|uniref:Uncharacterized protein n=1 Tax=Caenorhabditis remanei TaxID=31234 RepID=A0A6A5GWK0_CAERE|nr:hypothetical protein GCK72_015456 [Caenorhabditis remanei]KAF1758996.1 hypothetical protein GCK72_015456 [Caenorhabditis remanei]